MSNREELFLNELSALTFENLKAWIREQSNQFSSVVVAPFDALDDPMNVLERTLELINVYRYTSKLGIIQDYEKALVEVFSEELIHPILHVGVIYKYLSIFVNCTPLGPSRNILSRILSQVVTKGNLRKSIYGARELHYDALELLTKLWITKDESFLGEFSIDDFLILSLKNDRNPRFFNITLTYFKNTRKIDQFFKAFEICYELIDINELYVLSDALTAMYWKDRSISWSHLASWLALYSIKKTDIDKFQEFCSYAKLLKLVIKRFEEEVDINLSSGREEGQYMIAVMILLLSVKDCNILSPTLIAEFFQNVNYGENAKYLEELFDEFPGCTETHLKNLILKRIKNFKYPIIHICAIYQLKNAVYDENDSYDLIPTNRLEIEIDDEDYITVMKIDNMSAELSNDWFKWPEHYSVTVSTPLDDIRMSAKWWNNVRLSIANT